MAGLDVVTRMVDGAEQTDTVIKICPNNTEGEIIEISGLLIQLPQQPKSEDILFSRMPKKDQHWQHIELPKELMLVKSMDDWYETPREFQSKFRPYIELEFERRKNGAWFMNNGVPTYITGHHYMFLQWSKIDIGYPMYLEFQRRLFLHYEACKVDPRSMGQVYVKCRRSGYTNMASGIIADEGTRVKDKLLGIMSKTGTDAQEAVFMSKVIPIFRSYPFFFKPIQDGTTNPRVELAFREPAKRITKSNKTSSRGEALDTIINWKNTTNNAYDGSKTHILFLDEAGKWIKPTDIRESWRIHRTCLLVGRKIIGKALVGSTVNPLDQGGRQYRDLYYNSDPLDRNDNDRTKSGLYRIFIPSYEALEGFFDRYGNPIVEDPEKPVIGIDGDIIKIGARTFLKNERKALMNDSYELNEVIRQFPFTEDEAFRDSTKASLFNIGKIYEQIQYNDELFPNPVVQGNFYWEGGIADSKVVFKPEADGRWRITWMPNPEDRNLSRVENGKRLAPNHMYGCGGVDSYDLDATVDGRSSKGACHMYLKFNMKYPSNMFVAEYASRPPLARIFYEDVLMASVFYGFPLLIENNKYGIVRYFESRGYDGYVMERPEHLGGSTNHVTVKSKGIPSNSQDVIQAHAQSIEAYIHEHVGMNNETGAYGNMYFNRTLEDWINFKIDDRTKYDLTISAGLALLGAQKVLKVVKKADFSTKVFFRKGKDLSR
jgi:hypothetical protein